MNSMNLDGGILVSGINVAKDGWKTTRSKSKSAVRRTQVQLRVRDELNDISRNLRPHSADVVDHPPPSQSTGSTLRPYHRTQNQSNLGITFRPEKVQNASFVSTGPIFSSSQLRPKTASSFSMDRAQRDWTFRKPISYESEQLRQLEREFEVKPHYERTSVLSGPASPTSSKHQLATREMEVFEMLTERDRAALSIGRLMMKAVLGKEDITTSDSVARFFVDNWLSKNGSSSSDADVLSMELMCELQRAMTVNKLTRTNVSCEMLDEEAFPGEQKRATANKAVAVVAFQVLDKLIAEFGSKNPILTDIKAAIYPCVFMDPDGTSMSAFKPHVSDNEATDSSKIESQQLGVHETVQIQGSNDVDEAAAGAVSVLPSEGPVEMTTSSTSVEVKTEEEEVEEAVAHEQSSRGSYSQLRTWGESVSSILDELAMARKLLEGERSNATLLRQQIVELSNERDDLMLTIVQLNEKTAEAINVAAALRTQLEDAHKATKAVLHKAFLLSQENDVLKKRLADNEDLARNLQDSLMRVNEALENLRKNQLPDIRPEYAQAQKTITSQKEDIESLQNRINGLQVIIKTYQATKKAMDDKRDALVAGIRDTQKKRAPHELSNIEKDMIEFISSSSSSGDSGGGKNNGGGGVELIALLERKILALEDDVRRYAVMEQQFKDADLRFALLESEYKMKLQVLQDELRAQIESRDKSIDALQKQNDRRKGELQDIQKVEAETRAVVDSMKTKMGDLYTAFKKKEEGLKGDVAANAADNELLKNRLGFVLEDTLRDQLLAAERKANQALRSDLEEKLSILEGLEGKVAEMQATIDESAAKMDVTKEQKRRFELALVRVRGELHSAHAQNKENTEKAGEDLAKLQAMLEAMKLELKAMEERLAKAEEIRRILGAEIRELDRERKRISVERELAHMRFEDFYLRLLIDTQRRDRVRVEEEEGKLKEKQARDEEILRLTKEVEELRQSQRHHHDGEQRELKRNRSSVKRRSSGNISVGSLHTDGGRKRSTGSIVGDSVDIPISGADHHTSDVSHSISGSGSVHESSSLRKSFSRQLSSKHNRRGSSSMRSSREGGKLAASAAEHRSSFDRSNENDNNAESTILSEGGSDLNISPSLTTRHSTDFTSPSTRDDGQDDVSGTLYPTTPATLEEPATVGDVIETEEEEKLATFTDVDDIRNWRSRLILSGGTFNMTANLDDELEDYSEKERSMILREVVDVLVQQVYMSSLCAEDSIDKLNKEVEQLRKVAEVLRRSAGSGGGEGGSSRSKGPSLHVADECTQTDPPIIPIDDSVVVGSSTNRSADSSADSSSAHAEGNDDTATVAKRYIDDLHAISSAVVDLFAYAKNICSSTNDEQPTANDAGIKGLTAPGVVTKLRSVLKSAQKTHMVPPDATLPKMQSNTGNKSFLDRNTDDLWHIMRQEHTKERARQAKQSLLKASPDLTTVMLPVPKSKSRPASAVGSTNVAAAAAAEIITAGSESKVLASDRVWSSKETSGVISTIQSLKDAITLRVLFTRPTTAAAGAAVSSILPAALVQDSSVVGQQRTASSYPGYQEPPLVLTDDSSKELGEMIRSNSHSHEDDDTHQLLALSPREREEEEERGGEGGGGGCYDELFTRLKNSFPAQDTIHSIPVSEVHQYAIGLNTQIVKYIGAAQKIEKKLKALGDHYFSDQQHGVVNKQDSSSPLRMRAFLNAIETPAATVDRQEEHERRRLLGSARPLLAGGGPLKSTRADGDHGGAAATRTAATIPSSTSSSLIGTLPMPKPSSASRFRVTEKPAPAAGSHLAKIRLQLTHCNDLKRGHNWMHGFEETREIPMNTEFEQ